MSHNVDKVLLNPEQVEHAHLSHVEMFQAKQNFLYFEEQQAAAKKKGSVTADNEALKPQQFKQRSQLLFIGLAINLHGSNFRFRSRLTLFA